MRLVNLPQVWCRRDEFCYLNGGHGKEVGVARHYCRKVRTTLIGVEVSGSGWVVRARKESTCRHSSYCRTFRDLPMQGAPMIFACGFGRWRCRNGNCERKIFTERLPREAAPHRQCTERMDDMVEMIGYSLGGRPTERLIVRLGVTISDKTILRQIKTRASAYCSSHALRVVGVDDWAWKKEITTASSWWI